MQPRQMRETFRPVFPRRMYSMLFSRLLGVLFDDTIPAPRHAAGHRFTRHQLQRGGRFLRRRPWDVEDAGDAHAAIRDGHGEMADLIDEAGVEHRAVEFPAALEHEL